jgi:uncharacterized membrane protein
MRVMLKFYRRLWQAFLATFVGSAGIAAFLFKDYRIGFFIMLALTILFLVITIIGIYYDYKDARKNPLPKEQWKMEISNDNLFLMLGNFEKRGYIH